MFRLKEMQIGVKPSEMTVKEYESSVRSIERKNKIKRMFNRILDTIDK